MDKWEETFHIITIYKWWKWLRKHQLGRKIIREESHISEIKITVRTLGNSSEYFFYLSWLGYALI